MHGVAFPIAHALAELDVFRPFRDEAVGMNGVVIARFRPLFLAMSPQMRFSGDSVKFSRLHIAVERADAEFPRLRTFHPPAVDDLLRRPELFEFFDGIVPFFALRTQTPAVLFLFPRNCQGFSAPRMRYWTSFSASYFDCV